jgi:hypothetical protein
MLSVNTWCASACVWPAGGDKAVCLLLLAYESGGASCVVSTAVLVIRAASWLLQASEDL